MISVAYAMGGAPGGDAGSSLGMLMPLIIMFGIFYFLLIRPQQKKQKEHRDMIASVKRGDKIVTSGGLHGVVTGLTDATLTIEVAPKIRVKVGRGFVASVVAGNLPSDDPIEK